MVLPRLHPRVHSSLLALVLAASASAHAQGLSVDAGPDRYVLPPATSIELSATVQGIRHLPDGERFSILWWQTAGAAAQILDADTLRPTLVPSQAGAIALRLAVRDPAGRIAMDDVMVFAFGAGQDAEVTGTRRKWQTVTLTFDHDEALDETSLPNPFLDYRLAVYLFHPATSDLRVVPGFFAADGNAAETSATGGTKWRARFSPDKAGKWHYFASFRTGSEVALSLLPQAGQPESFDGASGSFFVEPADPGAPGFLSKGRLDYVGKHHLRFGETHEYFVKTGANSPENLLAYYEFDGTSDQGGVWNALNASGAQDGLHHFDAHLADYVDLGAPTWKNGKGKRIFGALSYLSAKGVNCAYTVTYNLDGGDGQEVWPWRTAAERERFDVSKLDQWERVTDHMTRAGIVWHVVTQEYENDHALDGGALGRLRKLYYRELVARFGHVLGLVWNLGEENTNSVEERMAFADYIRAIDPYDHPISLHNLVGDIPGTFLTLLGTHLELLSIQGDPTNTPPRVQRLVDDSAAAGRPWVVNFDEQSPAHAGAVPDAWDFWHDTLRRNALWPSLLAQGGGVEWYFGNGYPHTDLDCEDFRSRDHLWTLTARAGDFLREHVPFDQMQHADSLATGTTPRVLASRGEHYLVFLPAGGPATLDLEDHAHDFVVSWFDTRNGGPLQSGSVAQVSGPGPQSIGTPPASGDWVAWVRRNANLAPVVESVSIDPQPLAPGGELAVRVQARDPNGPTDVLSVHVAFLSPTGALTAVLPLEHRGGSLYSFVTPHIAPLTSGTWEIIALVEDSTGLRAARFSSFVAP